MKDDRYKRLEIYQLARSLAVQIHTITLEMPTTDFTGYEVDIRRSAKSIVHDLVDAYQHQSNRNDMLQLLRRARAWCEKTLALLDALHAAKAFSSDEHYQYLRSSYRRLDGMILKTMEKDIDSPESPFLVREEPAVYGTKVVSGAPLVSPLEGKVVLVTRAEDQSWTLVELLDREGAYGLGVPMIEIVGPDSWDACDKAIVNLRKYEGVFFTSTNAVRMFLGRMAQINDEAKSILATRSIFAVGEKTKSALEEAGLSVAPTPSSYTSEDLAKSLNDQEVKGKTFLLPRGDLGKDTFANRLRENHAVVDEVIVYRNARPEGVKARHLQQLFEHHEIDVVTFFSPSSVSNFIDIVEPELIVGVPIAVIGPTTARAVKEAGLNPQIIAKRSTSESLVETMREYFEQSTGESAFTTY